CQLFYIRLVNLILTLVVMSACHSIDTIERPDIPTSAAWNTLQADAEISSISSGWWKNFNSPELNRLIDVSLAQSPDLRIAAERVRQAELQMNIAGASLFPALNLSASS